MTELSAKVPINSVKLATDKKNKGVPSMAVKFDQQFNASADQLWAIVGTPDRIDWVPGASSCTFDGSVRSLSLSGAGDIKERILSHSDQLRSMEYSCFETPAPLQSHHSSIQVIAQGNKCRLLWETSVEPVDIESFIHTSMAGCIERLTAILQQPAEDK
jgi:hypothetical protein